MVDPFRGVQNAGHGNYITPISCRNYSDRPISGPNAHTGTTTTTLSKNDPTATTVIVKTNSKGGENPAAKVKAKPRKRPNPKIKAKTTSRSNAKAKPGPKKIQQKQRLDAKKARLKTNSEKAKQKKKVEKVKQKEKLEKAKQKAKQKEKLENAKKREQLPAAKAKKAKTLVLHPPRQGERSVWQVIISETARSPEMATSPAHVISKEASTRYRGLSTERREHYNRILAQLKASNEAAYHQWVESHSPEQIRGANLARKFLNRNGLGKYKKIVDKRQVKGMRLAHIIFNGQRQALGKYAEMAIPDRTKMIQKEWNELPASDKKKFEDMALQDRQRYVQEVKDVYDRTVRERASDVPAATSSREENMSSNKQYYEPHSEQLVDCEVPRSFTSFCHKTNPRRLLKETFFKEYDDFDCAYKYFSTLEQ
ncbi:hypothetical protein MMC29_007057 [Sticta canariensis]|nr:hypothetical protein [Sticta canariensis]